MLVLARRSYYQRLAKSPVQRPVAGGFWKTVALYQGFAVVAAIIGVSLGGGRPTPVSALRALGVPEKAIGTAPGGPVTRLDLSAVSATPALAAAVEASTSLRALELPAERPASSWIRPFSRGRAQLQPECPLQRGTLARLASAADREQRDPPSAAAAWSQHAEPRARPEVDGPDARL